MTRNLGSAVMLLLIAAAAPVVAQTDEEASAAGKPAADKREVTFSAGVGATDNVASTATDEISETMLSAGMVLNIEQSTRRLETHATGDLNYIEYLDNTFDSELVGRIDGELRLALMPEHVYWTFSDNFGQAQVDLFAPVSPVNRENVNFFSTGPDAKFRLGEQGFLELAGRYSSVAYEESPLDASRVFGGLGVGRELASGSRLSVNVNYEDLDFDDDVANTDYDRASAYLRYEVKGARTEFSANAGATNVDDGSETSGPLLQLELKRQLSSASELNVSAGKQFTDAADSFRSGPSAITGGSSTAPAALSSDTFDRKYLGIGWRYERHRTSFGLSVQYDDDEYEQRPELDVVRTDLQLNVSRQLTPTLSGRIFASYDEYKYDNVDFTDKNNRYGAALDYLFGRHLGLALRLEHTERTVDGGGSPYDENRGFLSLNWRAD